MDSSSVNPTQVSFNSRCSFTRTRHQETLHRFSRSKDEVFTRTRHPETLHRFSISKDAVLHGFVISKPYTGFLPSKDAVSHRLIISQPNTGFLLSKMQFYTSSLSGNLTQVPSFNLQKLRFNRQSPDGIYKPIHLPTVSKWHL